MIAFDSVMYKKTQDDSYKSTDMAMFYFGYANICSIILYNKNIVRI